VGRLVAQRLERIIIILQTIDGLDNRSVCLSSALCRLSANSVRGGCVNLQRLSNDPLDTQMLKVKLTLLPPLSKSFRIRNERAEHFR
jgi:hypothetical protein